MAPRHARPLVAVLHERRFPGSGSRLVRKARRRPRTRLALAAADGPVRGIVVPVASTTYYSRFTPLTLQARFASLMDELFVKSCLVVPSVRVTNWAITFTAVFVGIVGVVKFF